MSTKVKQVEHIEDGRSPNIAYADDVEAIVRGRSPDNFNHEVEDEEEILRSSESDEQRTTARLRNNKLLQVLKIRFPK